MSDRFSGEQLDQVADAVATAEQRTAGEIVTYFVERCDSHPEGVLRGGILGALLGAIFSICVFAFDPLRASFSGELGFWLAVLAPLILGPFVALLAAWSEPFERRLLRSDDLRARVEQRAEAAFLEEQVFATRDRTGVLIFLALFEHRAVVLADRGIAERVEQARWDRVVDDLCAGLREDRVLESVVGAVEACGRILEQAGVERRPDDQEELANRPVVRER